METDPFCVSERTMCVLVNIPSEWGLSQIANDFSRSPFFLGKVHFTPLNYFTSCMFQEMTLISSSHSSKGFRNVSSEQ
uniref:Uncharacterized protein n=1 Tax=Arundo donax TaxID=35708 RepID=A0A0A8ZWP1_ARUDO